MTSTLVRHPILRLQVITEDGTRHDDHRVFCRLQHRSVRVDDCVQCHHFDAVTDGAGATVDCSIPEIPSMPSDDPTGEWTEIGVILCTGTVVVAQSAAVDSALRVLRTEERRSVPIVDENHVLVGMIHETGFMGRRSLRGLDGAISAAMSTAIAVHERTPVRVALRLLAANHLREATVVSADGIPIGVFRDVDGLHWIGLARGTAR